jgi:murein DD-endopeptidase MepM/ murein hydrolase activator NlpD
MKEMKRKLRELSLKDLSDEVLHRLAVSGGVGLLTVALLSFSLVGGMNTGYGSIQDLGKSARVALADLDIASIFSMNPDGDAEKQLKVASAAESEETDPVQSVFGEFYDSSNVDPNAVSIITINGQRIVYMRTAEEAQQVLEGIIKRYTEGNSQITSANFAETVEIITADDYVTAEMAAENKKVTETYLCQVEEAINYIMNGTSQPKTYTVQSGDTMWDIAKKNGISPYQLAEMNPGFNADRLSIGDVLYLYEVQPFLNVTTVEVATETETIPFTTQYTETSELYKGQSRVTSYGSYGSKEKQVQYVKQNGVIVSSSVLSETVLSEPVTQYAEVGTTTMPIKTGSGSLISPVGSTTLSSAAGAYGASRGSRRHAGVDLKANSGDPIYASDAGTVVFAGYSNSYGNIVKISHGNGVETRYAHCASLLVSYGDNVEKGQQIATVGKTGNATGYLCHFEVLVNGSTVNPLNYI